MKRVKLGVSVLAVLGSLPMVLAASDADPYFKYMAGIALVLLVIVFLVNPKRKKKETLQVQAIQKEKEEPKLVPSVQKIKEEQQRQERTRKQVQKIYNEEDIYVVNPEGKHGYRAQAIAVKEEDI